MARTFNCGLGAVLVVSPVDAQMILHQLQAEEQAWIVGSLVRKQPGETLMLNGYTEYSTCHLSKPLMRSKTRNVALMLLFFF